MQCVCGQNWCEAWNTCSARPGRAGHRLPGSPPAENHDDSGDEVWPEVGWTETVGSWRASWQEELSRRLREVQVSMGRNTWAQTWRYHPDGFGDISVYPQEEL